MKTITTLDLNTVCGGASKSDSAVTQQLASLQSSIKDLGSQNNNKSNELLPLMMVMALGQKQQGPTVVAAGAPAAPVVAGGPVVNISSRIGRRW